MDAWEIIEKYYDDAEDEIFPGFFDYEDSTVEKELIPGYEKEYIVYGIHKAKPEFAGVLDDNGYDIIYHIIGTGSKFPADFLGVYTDNQLIDVTPDIISILKENNLI